MTHKRFLVAICLFLALPFTGVVDDAIQAKVKFGARGGTNITKMSFDSKVLNSSNRSGFYLGPTMRIGTGVFGLDASLLYSQTESKSTYYEGSTEMDYPSLVRKTIVLPVNLSLGIGLGDKLNAFVFAGPQAELCVGGDIHNYVENGGKALPDFDWRDLAMSVNVGIGVTVLDHLEIRANYGIPCSTAGEFNLDTVTESIVTGKSGSWQLGVAIYF